MTSALLDEIVHQPVRLKLMAALDAEPHPGQLAFPRLKEISGATDGNLGAHLMTLENAGYVTVEKEAVGKRFRTLVAITHAGRNAFRGHLSYLQEILDGPHR